ncbi:MAG: response regulator [Myxococcota bacterium]
MRVSGTVLLVDDEPSVTAALKRVLHSEPYRVLEAPGAQAALQQLEAGEIDVLVTDENMPGMNGTELLCIARERWPDTVRIMLTGTGDLEVAKRAINDGQIYRFFSKPCNDFDLVFGLRSALELVALRRACGGMLGQLRRQTGVLEELEREHPELLKVRRDASGAVLLRPNEVPDDLEKFLESIESELERAERLTRE